MFKEICKIKNCFIYIYIYIFQFKLYSLNRSKKVITGTQASLALIECVLGLLDVLCLLRSSRSVASCTLFLFFATAFQHVEFGTHQAVGQSLRMTLLLVYLNLSNGTFSQQACCSYR